MGGDPYTRILTLFRGESAELSKTGESAGTGLGAQPAKMRCGKVIQRAPLKISVMGVNLPAEAFRVNERLMKGAQWRASIAASGVDGPVTSQATVEQTETDLEVGDEVLLLTEDDQLFFVLMKVVKAV